MARSLTVKHEETPTTSALLTGFLLLAVACLALSAIGLGSAEAAPDAPMAATAP